MQLPSVLFALVLALQLVGADLAPTGTLRAAFIANNPVQGRVDAQTGALSGPAPDLAQELARRLEVPLDLTPLPSARAVLDSVRTGQADIGFLAYQAARVELVDYSDPYLLSGSAYAVRADSSLRRTAEVDRAGVTVGAVAGQGQAAWVSENITAAQIHTIPAVPPNAGLAALLLDGTVDAFAANRTRMEELALDFPAVRVLEDNFLVTSQAIVVAQGARARLDALNPFLAEVRASGFVQDSIDRANIPGVEVAPTR